MERIGAGIEMFFLNVLETAFTHDKASSVARKPLLGFVVFNISLPPVSIQDMRGFSFAYWGNTAVIISLAHSVACVCFNLSRSLQKCKQIFMSADISQSDVCVFIFI